MTTTAPRRITVREVPVYPETQLITDPTDPSLEPVTVPHPLAGQIDLSQLQEDIGDAVWVGAGSKWALPWEKGVVPITVTADHAPSPDPANWGEVANMCLIRVVRYNLDLYPSAGEIRAELAGKDLAIDDRTNDASHVDVLLALANGSEYSA